MDICLNISSVKIEKKTINENVSIKKKPNKDKFQKPTDENCGFEFKWEKKKSKKAFVNNITKTTTINVKPNLKKNESQEETSTSKYKNTNTELPKKHYTLFNKYSEAAKGTTFDRMDGNPSVEQVFSNKGSKFKDLSIHSHTMTNLERIGLTVLTAVQERAIPEILSGKNVFIRSQTGSGKTLAYALPIVESLRSIDPHIKRKDGIQAVVVVPTRELALQTYELFLKLVEPFRWIVPGILCGGENRSSEKARLRKGISILIGTPGRLLDHVMHTQNLRLDKVRCLVLDEADRLLDMGFQKDVNKLIEQIDASKNLEYDPLALLKSKNQSYEDKPEFSPSQSSNLPPLIDVKSKLRQTILLSATLTNNVKDLATFAMSDHIYIDPLNPNSKVDIHKLPDQADYGSNVAVPQSVKQQFVVTDVKTRLVVLSSFIVDKAREDACKMFIFMASKQMVEYHELLFKKCLVKRQKKEENIESKVMISLDEDSDDDEDEENVLDIEFFKLHGSMNQKERTEVFKAFRATKKGVLLCTDVAARGVDIPHADYVVQYTTPLQDEDYIHRVGRTGRVGEKGLGLLFITEPELNYIAHLKSKNIILKRIKQDSILQHLLSFMEYSNPSNVQAAAEILQRRFEKAVLADKSLHSAACMAYSTWSRYYSSYPVALKKYFDIKKAHLGHYVTSFALRESPQQVGRFVRNEIGKNNDVKLNKKLDNYEIEETNISKPLRLKKRPRDQELVVSEFDSGLPSKKKKK